MGGRRGFGSLPLEWAFKRVKGTGARKIAIFADPDCAYCKKFEQTLKGVSDLTVYVFLFPIEQIHPGATAKSVAIWCAKDRLKAWDEIVQLGTMPTVPATCDNPIPKIVDFARRHQISGTPTTIFEDGRRLVGTVPHAELEANCRERRNDESGQGGAITAQQQALVAQNPVCRAVLLLSSLCCHCPCSACTNCSCPCLDISQRPTALLLENSLLRHETQPELCFIHRGGHRNAATMCHHDGFGDRQTQTRAIR